MCVFSPVPESAGVSSSPPPVHRAETAAQSSLKHSLHFFLHLLAIFLPELVSRIVFMVYCVFYNLDI